MSTESKNRELLIYYLSQDRLKPYLDLADDDFEEAIKLYTKNKNLSSDLHALLTELEVIFRNSINNILIEEIGTDWLLEKNTNLNEIQSQAITNVIKSLEKQNKKASNANIVSNLNFGFWVYLFNANYDKTLWRMHLYKIFKNPPKGFKRSKARAKLEKFKKLRNRISHCENILQYPYEKYPSEIIEFINYINPKIAEWVEEITK